MASLQHRSTTTSNSAATWQEPALDMPLPKTLVKPLFNLLVGDFIFQSDPFQQVARKVLLGLYVPVMVTGLGLMGYSFFIYTQYNFLADLLIGIGFLLLAFIIFTLYFIMRSTQHVTDRMTFMIALGSAFHWTICVICAARAYELKLVSLTCILLGLVIGSPGAVTIFLPWHILLMALSIYNDSFREESGGFPPLELPSRNSEGLERLLGNLVPTTTSLLCVLSVWVAVYKLTRPPRDNSLAPKDPRVPFAVVFTDVQSSTMLWAKLPAVMAVAMEVHHEVIRKQIELFRGYEVKTIGDAFMVVFKDPQDAMLFALSAQRALNDSTWDGYADRINAAYRDVAANSSKQRSQEEQQQLQQQSHSTTTPSIPPPSNNPTLLQSAAAASPATTSTAFDAGIWNGLRVRMGVHYGIGEPKLDPVTWSYDYYGTVVNAASRVASVGHGGQLLLSGATFEAIMSKPENTDALPFIPTTGEKIVDHNLGTASLRGLSRPMQVHQVACQGLRARSFSPLKFDDGDNDNEENDEVAEYSDIRGGDGGESTDAAPSKKASNPFSVSDVNNTDTTTTRVNITRNSNTTTNSQHGIIIDGDGGSADFESSHSSSSNLHHHHGALLQHIAPKFARMRATSTKQPYERKVAW